MSRKPQVWVVDDLDSNRGFRTRIHACGLAAIGQPAVAHVALTDHAAFRVVLRDAVGTVPSAVLAANAGFWIVLDDTGNRILFVGLDRTTDQA